MKKSINFAENNNVRRNETLDIYLSEMNRYKTLSDAELRDLIIKAQNGNERARSKAITANLRIVWSIAASYNGMDNFADILQNGNIGLCRILHIHAYLGAKLRFFSLKVHNNRQNVVSLQANNHQRDRI
jgi:DNA-directed RNA polymerase sigma subunit (sigma70/sigma32)